MSRATAWTQFRPANSEFQHDNLTQFVTVAGVPQQFIFSSDNTLETRVPTNAGGTFEVFPSTSPDFGIIKPRSLYDVYVLNLNFCVDEPIGVDNWVRVEYLSGGSPIAGKTDDHALIKNVGGCQWVSSTVMIRATHDIFDNGVEIFITTSLDMTMDQFILDTARIYNT